MTDLPKIDDYKIHRSFLPVGFGKNLGTELHTCAYASQHAYGVASYLRFLNKDGKVHCCFVMGKSRLALINTMTIPKLELQVTELAVMIGRLF